MPKTISVLLVDDHNLVRRGFRRLLEDEADITVAGEAAEAPTAIEMAASLNPDVIVMDCALGDSNGLDATRSILKNNSEARILMLSMHSEDTWVQQARDAGAKGYVLKNAMDLDLAAAIRRVHAGEFVIDPRLDHPPALKGEGGGALTPRELEILRHICEGKSNKEIAVELGLSSNTVAVHRANIMDALGIHKTAELVVYAIRSGLVNLP
jgi:DNA-binding NarL/FixJ family response regulator